MRIFIISMNGVGVVVSREGEKRAKNVKKGLKMHQSVLERIKK